MKKQGKRQQRGQSLVEFAIMLTIMITLLAGAVDLGTAFFSFIALRDAAQEGAVYGSVAAIIDKSNPKNNIFNAGVDEFNQVKIIQRVRQSSTQPVDLNGGDVDVVVEVDGSVNGAGVEICAGHLLTVRVIYTYTFTMPFVSAILGPTTDITAEATNVILWPQCP